MRVRLPARRGGCPAYRYPDAIRARDVVIVLISAAAARSKWTAWELDLVTSGDLDQRGVDIIPALLDETDLPIELARRRVVDLPTTLIGVFERL